MGYTKKIQYNMDSVVVGNNIISALELEYLILVITIVAK
jgi:hypothetical protein